MPVVGETLVRKPGNGYVHDPMAGMAKEFLNLSNSILEEGRLDIYTEPSKVFRRDITDSAMKNFFIENSCDAKDPILDTEGYEDHICMMEQLYENDKQAVLEHSGMGQFNPVIGMTFPIHKNIMLNNIFDKGAIPKLVATSPKFTVSMETRWLIDPETNERYVPYCIEPSVGVERLVLAFLVDAYDEEKLVDSKGKEDVRVVLRLHPALAPYKAAVLPLSKKLGDTAMPIYEELSKYFMVEYDASGSIGKRYRREDEIGTPFCICVDFDTAEDGCVTIRDRDTMEQVRIPVSDVRAYIEERLEF